MILQSGTPTKWRRQIGADEKAQSFNIHVYPSEKDHLWKYLYIRLDKRLKTIVQNYVNVDRLDYIRAVALNSTQLNEFSSEFISHDYHIT